MRLIDADALKEIMFQRKKPEHGANSTKERWRYIQWLTDYRAIEDAPTVDAVEVTRCNGCRFGYPRFWASYGEYRCQRFRNDIFRGDHFCSWGEPRPEDIEL